MLTIRAAQLQALEGERRDGFLPRLARAVAREYGALGLADPATARTRIEPLVQRARELGFATPREAAAYVMAVLPLGEARLAATEGFALAAFDVSASPSRRARRLMDALDEALARGTQDHA